MRVCVHACVCARACVHVHACVCVSLKIGGDLQPDLKTPVRMFLAPCLGALMGDSLVCQKLGHNWCDIMESLTKSSSKRESCTAALGLQSPGVIEAQRSVHLVRRRKFWDRG